MSNNQQSGMVTFLQSDIEAAIHMMRFRCGDIFILKHQAIGTHHH